MKAHDGGYVLDELRYSENHIGSIPILFHVAIDLHDKVSKRNETGMYVSRIHTLSHRLVLWGL